MPDRFYGNRTNMDRDRGPYRRDREVRTIRGDRFEPRYSDDHGRGNDHYGADDDRRGGRSWFSGEDRDRDRDYDRGYGPDDHNSGLAMDETDRLIASNKVEGTAVYGRNGEKLGTVHNLMIDKYSGQVEYAVLKYSSGFLGFGEEYCPLRWRELHYDRRDQGYRVDMMPEDLKRRDRYDSTGRRVGRNADRR